MEPVDHPAMVVGSVDQDVAAVSGAGERTVSQTVSGELSGPEGDAWQTDSNPVGPLSHKWMQNYENCSMTLDRCFFYPFCR